MVFVVIMRFSTLILRCGDVSPHINCFGGSSKGCTNSARLEIPMQSSERLRSWHVSQRLLACFLLDLAVQLVFTAC